MLCGLADLFLETRCAKGRWSQRNQPAVIRSSYSPIPRMLRFFSAAIALSSGGGFSPNRSPS
jgi:hypothetical protein